MTKINKNIKSYVNLCVFSKEQQDVLRKTKEIKNEDYGEFVKISRKEQDNLLGVVYDGTWHYYLVVDYDEPDVQTYRGIKIFKNNGDEDIEIIRINSGDIKLDEELSLDALSEIAGEVNVSYLSSYDDYFMDLKMSQEKRIKE